MPQTEQQVCAVLVSGHLSPAECLALFQCSKSLAVTILHNAQCVSLTLRGHPAQPATDSASESPTSSGAAGHAPGSSAGDTNGTALANGARPSSNGHAEPDCSQVRGKAAGPGPHSGAAACADGAVPKAACKRSSEGSLPRRDAAQQGDQRDHQVSTAMRLACHASSITLILDAALPPIPILPELVPRVRTVVLRRMRVQPDALVETLSALCSLDLAPPVYTPSGTDSDTSSSFTSCASSSTAAGRGRFGALVLEQCQIITPPGPPCTPHNATVQHHSTDDAPSVLSSLTGQTSNVKGLGVGEGADRGAEYGQGLGQEKSEEGAARRIRMGRLRLENCAPTAALAAAAAAALATSCLDTHTLTDVELELHPTLSHGSPDEPRSDHIAAAGAAGAAAVAANAPPLGAAAVAVGGPAVLATAAAAAALSPLSALPALRRLRICGFSLSDAALSWLFTHPSLEYACVDGLLLAVNEDHHLKRVSALRELELSQGCHVASLAALPLPELARVCVKSCLSLQVEGLHKLERALSKVLPYQSKVQTLPTSHKECWDPKRPAFELLFPEDCPSDIAQQAVTIACNGLAADLMLSWAPVTVLPALQAALPPTITCVTFFGELLHWEQLQGSFVNHLPDHVTQVVLGKWFLSLDSARHIVTGATDTPTDASNGSSATEKDDKWLCALLRGWAAQGTQPSRAIIDVCGGVSHWP